MSSDSEAVEMVLRSLSADSADRGVEEITPQLDQVEELLKRLEEENKQDNEDSGVDETTDNVDDGDDDDPEITLNIREDDISIKDETKADSDGPVNYILEDGEDTVVNGSSSVEDQTPNTEAQDTTNTPDTDNIQDPSTTTSPRESHIPTPQTPQKTPTTNGLPDTSAPATSPRASTASILPPTTTSNANGRVKLLALSGETSSSPAPSTPSSAPPSTPSTSIPSSTPLKSSSNTTPATFVSPRLTSPRQPSISNITPKATPKANTPTKPKSSSISTSALIPKGTMSAPSSSPSKERAAKPWHNKPTINKTNDDDIVVAAPAPKQPKIDTAKSKQDAPSIPKLTSPRNNNADEGKTKASPRKMISPRENETTTKPSSLPSPRKHVNNNTSSNNVDMVDADNKPMYTSADMEELRKQILYQVSQEAAILDLEHQELKAKYDKEVMGNAKLKSALMEYEKTLSSFLAEGHLAHNSSNQNGVLAERVATLEAENKRKTSEAEGLEIAFNDLKTRYEDQKLLNEKLRLNEQILKETVSRQNNDLQSQESRFDKLKLHAETKLDNASEKLAQMKSDAARELALITAKLQKAETRISSLEDEVQDKENKNRELLTICDELLTRVK